MNQNEIAIHKIADAYRTIFDNLQHLTPDQRAILGPINAYRADMLEKLAPFTPVTDEEKQTIFEEVCDEFSDYSPKELAEEYLDFAEWQWRAEADVRKELREEEL